MPGEVAANPHADLVAGVGMSLVQRGVNGKGTPTVATGGTLPSTRPFFRLTTAGAITGVILQKGSVDGQTIVIANTSANSVTFAVVATSNVLDGANVAIAATRACYLVWDASGGSWVAIESTT